MIIQGNSFRLPLADNSVHCIITSIPYWNLRDYGLPPLVFGGLADCRHEWGIEKTIKQNPQRDHNGADFGDTRGYEQSRQGMAYETSTGQFCRLCHAWRGQYGLEPSISLFIQHSVEVARECKRILRPDGVMWWNLGDTYATGKNGRSAADGKALGSDDRTFRDKPFTVDELPAKNLCLIPERIVIALQDDGWIVRSVIPWEKGNPMPESVADRPGTAHEYVFMLVKSKRNYFDMEAVRRGVGEQTRRAASFRDGGVYTGNRSFNNNGSKDKETHGDGPASLNGRALRTSDFFFDSLDAYIAHLQDIRDNGGLMLEADGSPAAFVVNPKPYKFSHYATFPIDLITPMIKCSTSERGCCPKCGKGWVRVVESKKDNRLFGREQNLQQTNGTSNRTLNGTVPSFYSPENKTLCWRPSCSCDAGPPVPAIILDPFVGSGTTVLAAQQLGRRGIGIDLNPTYLLENALPRTAKKGGRSLEDLPLFALQEDTL